MTVKLDVLDALRYGIGSLRTHAGLLLAPALAYSLVTEGMGLGLDRLGDAESAMFFPAFLLYLVLVFFLSLGFTKVALKLFDGQPTGFGDYLRWNPEGGRYLGASVLLAIATGVGTMFFVVPGLLAATFFGFALWVVIDRGDGAVASLGRSLELIRGNHGRVLLLTLILSLPSLAGALLADHALPGHTASALIQGLTFPIYWMAMTYAYRRLTGAQ